VSSPFRAKFDNSKCFFVDPVKRGPKPTNSTVIRSHSTLNVYNKVDRLVVRCCYRIGVSRKTVLLAPGTLPRFRDDNENPPACPRTAASSTTPRRRIVMRVRAKPDVDCARRTTPPPSGDEDAALCSRGKRTRSSFLS